MLRTALFAVLVASILSGSAQAQRAGGTSQGHVAGVGVRSGPIGQRGSPNGFHPRSGVFPRRSLSSRGFHSRHLRDFGSVFAPYFDPFESDESYAEPETIAALPQINQPRTPDTLPLPKSQVIEIPGVTNSTSAKSLPPTIFVLAGGERLETRRFILTASNLSVSIDRQQRTLPLNMLDLTATIAANRERGIDLRIPDDRNEISVSF